MQSFFQDLINIFAGFINLLFSWLPNSPFTFITQQYTDYISKINYFIPVYEFVAIGQAWLTAVTVWYAYVVVARWLKAVE